MNKIIETFTFNDGKRMYKDEIAYANGEYVLLSDYKKVVDELKHSKYYITQLKAELEKKVDFETDRLVKLPFDAMETANMLINATYKRENCMTGKVYDKDIYSIDDLKQIAEHLLVYCKHNREDQE